jgi:hypothetical protein
VNGYPAQFTDAEIRWTIPIIFKGKVLNRYYDSNIYDPGEEVQAGGLDYVPNRYSGSLRMGTVRFPVVRSGQCSPVAERKF